MNYYVSGFRFINGSVYNSRSISHLLTVITGRGGGLPPYIGCTGMCGPKGFGFSAVLALEYFADVEPFVRENDHLAPATRDHLMEIFNSPADSCQHLLMGEITLSPQLIIWRETGPLFSVVMSAWQQYPML